jgi:NAD(P)-dependent dehydrogenase (short-subunit alcohol dehydrogenase family)
MELNLQGMTALVTGGTRGIGRAAVAMLLAEGCRVFATGSSQESLERAREEFRDFGGQFGVTSGRLEDAATAPRFVAEAVERFGELSVVVNNAGFYAYKTYEEFTRADWTSLVEMKLIAYESVIRAAIPHLKRRGGAVVNVAGIAALVPFSETPQVGAVNAGVLAMTRFFARKLAGEKVTVNAVTPGPVRTDRHEMRRRILEAEEGLSREAAEERLAAGIPTHHVIDPGEVAMVIAMLCSPRLKGLTGSNVVIDSGRSLMTSI